MAKNDEWFESLFRQEEDWIASRIKKYLGDTSKLFSKLDHHSLAKYLQEKDFKIWRSDRTISSTVIEHKIIVYQHNKELEHATFIVRL